LIGAQTADGSIGFLNGTSLTLPSAQALQSTKKMLRDIKPSGIMRGSEGRQYRAVERRTGLIHHPASFHGRYCAPSSRRKVKGPTLEA
jgi:hypothetical protein